jgi:hypothetical protein
VIRRPLVRTTRCSKKAHSSWTAALSPANRSADGFADRPLLGGDCRTAGVLAVTPASFCMSFEVLTCTKGTVGLVWSTHTGSGRAEPETTGSSQGAGHTGPAWPPLPGRLLMCLPRTARPTRASRIPARRSASGRAATVACVARAAALPRPSDDERSAPPALGWPRPRRPGGVRSARPGACRRSGSDPMGDARQR